MKLKSTSSLGLLLSLYLSVVCQVQATLGAFWQAVQIVFQILVCQIVELKVCSRLRELYLFGIFGS